MIIKFTQSNTNYNLRMWWGYGYDLETGKLYSFKQRSEGKELVFRMSGNKKMWTVSTNGYKHSHSDATIRGMAEQILKTDKTYRNSNKGNVQQTSTTQQTRKIIYESTDVPINFPFLLYTRNRTVPISQAFREGTTMNQAFDILNKRGFSNAELLKSDLCMLEITTGQQFKFKIEQREVLILEKE